DNDCDGQKDEMPVLCDDPATLSAMEPYDFARAIELCDTDHKCGVEQGCPGELACVEGVCRRVLSASFDGDPKSRSIDVRFAKEGPLKPRTTQSFAILSTGLAMYDPRVVGECPQIGTSYGLIGIDPDPTISDPDANDLSELKFELLVPTNARSFSFEFHFLTSEYPDYLDTEFNDTFWVQLISKKIIGNISFDKKGTPIRLNNAFFDICDPDPAHPKTVQFCTEPAQILTGTGMAKDCVTKDCGAISCGGSTGWLITKAPVEPGEIITLIFSIFDKGDDILDSTVLIDNFRWHLNPAQTGTEPVQ
ncbi:MAG: choice-of-anchor L domain-containing protein, partial [Pseudomonadota bacterium]